MLCNTKVNSIYIIILLTFSVLESKNILNLTTSYIKLRILSDNPFILCTYTKRFIYQTYLPSIFYFTNSEDTWFIFFDMSDTSLTVV